LVLSDDERQTLLRWTRRAKSSQALAMRARIVLACADGTPNTRVAEQLGVSRDMVGKWRSRFVAKRLEGLSDEPRPGAPRKLTDDVVEAVVVATLEQAPPGGDSHWSTRSMAKAVGLNQTAVSRIWRAFGLKPHLTDDWKLSTDPQFIEKVPRHRRVVSLAAGRGDGPGGGREEPDAGIGPHCAGAADDACRTRADRPKTTSGTARPACSPRWTWPPAR